jgi:hypothetical protein
MEDESNLNSKTKLWITIIAFILFALFGYIIYENYFNPVKKLNSYSNIVSNATDLLKTYNTLNNTYDFSKYFYGDDIVNVDSLTDSQKSWIVYSHLYKDNKLTTLSLNCNLLKEYNTATYNICVNNGIDYTFITKAEKIAYDDFVNEYHNIFGSSSNISTSKFGSTGVSVFYSNANNCFVALTLTGVGGVDAYFAVSAYKSAMQYANRIEVEQYYAQCSINTTNDSGLQCYSGTKLVKSDSSITSKNNIDATSFAQLYKLTFKKDTNGNYYWYSTEPIITK